MSVKLKMIHSKKCLSRMLQTWLSDFEDSLHSSRNLSLFFATIGIFVGVLTEEPKTQGTKPSYTFVLNINNISVFLLVAS